MKAHIAELIATDHKIDADKALAIVSDVFQHIADLGHLVARADSLPEDAEVQNETKGTRPGHIPVQPSPKPVHKFNTTRLPVSSPHPRAKRKRVAAVASLDELLEEDLEELLEGEGAVDVSLDEPGRIPELDGGPDELLRVRVPRRAARLGGPRMGRGKLGPAGARLDGPQAGAALAGGRRVVVRVPGWVAGGHGARGPLRARWARPRVPERLMPLNAAAVEMIAERLHALGVEAQRRAGTTSLQHAGVEIMVPWSILPEHAKEAIRSSVVAMDATLDSLGLCVGRKKP